MSRAPESLAAPLLVRGRAGVLGHCFAGVQFEVTALVTEYRRLALRNDVTSLISQIKIHYMINYMASVVLCFKVILLR